MFSAPGFQRLLENETFEPALDWGLRMGFAATLPVVWGTMTGHVAAASWITLTAEAITWVELKGSFGIRLRVLIVGALLTTLFAIVGSITADNMWLGIAGMLGIGFLSGLFKNLGDRGSGLAISMYVMFLIANAHPTLGAAELKGRIVLTLIGGVWALVVGLLASAFIPAQAPYRRTIALIWKAIASLVHEIAKGWDGKELRSGMRLIYQKEQEVRNAIDHSIHFYDSLAHQVSSKDKDEFHLAHIRKVTALVATHIEAIGGELELIRVNETPAAWRKALAIALRSLERAMERFATYMLLLKGEEELLLLTRLDKLRQSVALLQEQQHLVAADQIHLHRIRHLLERCVKLMDSALRQLQQAGHNHSVFHPYPLFKSLVMLHPAKWQKNIELLLDPNTNTMRYAIRSALAAACAMFLWKFFAIPYGYWIPFTVLLVMQPYFAATLKKAIDRVIGTVAGVIAGGVFVGLPTGLYLVELALFVSFVMMIYFLRKNYSIAAFFITLSLVLLFDVEQQINFPLILTRVLATLAGACIAIIAGFVLLPTWDRKWLPRHVAEALIHNYDYFKKTCFQSDAEPWTKYKRTVEISNSHAYDSFIRFMQEPGTNKRKYISYFQIISHGVRVTRLLNNINIEQEAGSTARNEAARAQVTTLISSCNQAFEQMVDWLQHWQPEKTNTSRESLALNAVILGMPSQQQYLERLLQELKLINQTLEHMEPSLDHPHVQPAPTTVAS